MLRWNFMSSSSVGTIIRIEYSGSTPHFIGNSLVTEQCPLRISKGTQPSCKNKCKTETLHVTRPDPIVFVVGILVGNIFDFGKRCLCARKSALEF